MNHRLQKLARGAQSLMPDWPLDIVPHIEAGWSQASPSQIAGLAASLADAYPEAGRHYWAFRTWGLLVWQPVYLTLAGIHLAGVGVRQECIGQQAAACMVWGCRIAEHAPFEGSEGELLEATAPGLRDGADTVRAACVRATGLHPKAARRLMADCVTAAMVKIGDLRRDWSADDAVAWGERWLRALHLGGAAGFLRYRDSRGGEHLAMERKVCCLVYKRRDGCLCDTCPRIPLADRIARLAH